MTENPDTQNIRTRHELFQALQAQMEKAYWDLRERRRLEFESSLIKSYIFEADRPDELAGQHDLTGFLSQVFSFSRRDVSVRVLEKDDEGFFEIVLNYHDDGRSQRLILYLDTITNPRFWLGFSLSSSQKLDWWFRRAVREQSQIDFAWLWPGLLEQIQSRGIPRGFGLDYDYRKFEDDDDTTTYLKMQLWGGAETQRIYELLRDDEDFRHKVVLSKVRMKEFSEGNGAFALQDIKYDGKFTTRGTDFYTHAATLSYTRSEYERHIEGIEATYALRWRGTETSNAVLEGFAMHFVPVGTEIPVGLFCERIFSGTDPFRILGFVDQPTAHVAVVDAVDLHTGGKLSFEIYPDLVSLYLPERTCGNTVARFYTNLQHYFSALFKVEADNGDQLFLSSTA